MINKLSVTLLGALSSAVIATPAPEFDPQVRLCPQQFHNVAIIQNAKQCQSFDDSTPASMTYFSTMSPAQAVSFYQELEMGLQAQPELNQRTLLLANEGNVRVVVAPDGEGSQIAILVVAP